MAYLVSISIHLLWLYDLSFMVYRFWPGPAGPAGPAAGTGPGSWAGPREKGAGATDEREVAPAAWGEGRGGPISTHNPPHTFMFIFMLLFLLIFEIVCVYSIICSFSI